MVSLLLPSTPCATPASLSFSSFYFGILEFSSERKKSSVLTETRTEKTGFFWYRTGWNRDYSVPVSVHKKELKKFRLVWVRSGSEPNRTDAQPYPLHHPLCLFWKEIFRSPMGIRFSLPSIFQNLDFLMSKWWPNHVIKVPASHLSSNLVRIEAYMKSGRFKSRFEFRLINSFAENGGELSGLMEIGEAAASEKERATAWRRCRRRGLEWRNRRDLLVRIWERKFKGARFAQRRRHAWILGGRRSLAPK